jgi:hypothetical protein
MGRVVGMNTSQAKMVALRATRAPFAKLHRQVRLDLNSDRGALMGAPIHINTPLPRSYPYAYMFPDGFTPSAWKS